MLKYRVESFGRDCLGNSSGYRVVRDYGFQKEIAGTFVANIYEAGSHDRAYNNAVVMCENMNRAAEAE